MTREPLACSCRQPTVGAIKCQKYCNAEREGSRSPALNYQSVSMNTKLDTTHDKQRQRLVFGVWCAIVQGLDLMPMPERGRLHQAILPLSMQTQKRAISSAFITFEEEVLFSPPTRKNVGF